MDEWQLILSRTSNIGIGMRIIYYIAIIMLFYLPVRGQGVINFGASRPQDTGLTKGYIKAPVYSLSDSNNAIGVTSQGMYRIRRQIMTKSYIDSLFSAITGGGVTLPQLNDSMQVIRSYIDSNDAEIWGSIGGLYDTLTYFIPWSDTSTRIATRSYVTTAISGKMNYTDTASLSNRIDQKLNSSDTASLSNRINQKLNSSDTAGLSNRINAKQNYSDTTTWDATKSYVIAQLLGYVPYTGATNNVNLGAYDLTTSNVHTDTVQANSSMGLQLHGTGGQGIMIGAGGGGNITFDAYPTTTPGDSVLTTNSSGGLLRYDLKGKLAIYLLKSDSTLYQTKYRSDTARSNLWPAINAKGTGSVTSVATGFGLSGGTITTSGTLLVDTTNVPTQYRVDTASRNAHNLANATGTLDTARLVTVATQGTYGDTISRLQISIDRKGRVISITPLTATTATIIVTTNFTTSYTLAATNKLPIYVKITAQAGSLTMNAPTGLYEGQQVVFIAKATGSNQTWSWNSAFAPLTNASGTTTTSFPTTISTAAATVVTCQYSATSNKLNLVSVKYNLDP